MESKSNGMLGVHGLHPVNSLNGFHGCAPPPATAVPMEGARRWAAVKSAQIEAYLSTRAFEIVFLGMYVMANVLMFIWGAKLEFHHVRDNIESENPTWTGFKWFIAIARGAGFSLNLNTAIIIILSCRLIITSIRETPLHKVLPLDHAFPDAHIMVAYAIVIGVVIHVPFHLVWLIRYQQFDTFKLWSYTWSTVMGVALLAVFGVMYIFALPSMRTKRFHVFYLVHLVFAVLFFVLLILHGMKRKKPETYMWVAPGLILFTIDRILRRLSIRKQSITVKEKHMSELPGRVLKLKIPKSFNYRAGQYAELAIPSIGKTNEWHPFTIASSPQESKMCFYIKVSGDWTSKLWEKVQKKEELSLRIRGPFGAPAQHAGSYSRVVLISGGIGSTPFAAICKDLFYTSKTTNLPHAMSMKKEAAKAEAFRDKDLIKRVTEKVSSLYDIEGIDGMRLNDDELNEKANYLADTLKLNYSFGRVDTRGMLVQDDDSDDEDESSQELLDDLEKGGVGFSTGTTGNQSFIQTKIQPVIHTFRARVLAFLHSTRVTLLLMVTILARVGLVCIIAIWDLASFNMTASQLKPSAYWACVTDAVLGFILSLVMGITLLLEISFMKSKFFSRSGRVVDFIAFLPLSIISAVLSLRTGSTSAHGAFTIQNFALLLPTLFLLLAARMYRSLGSRDLLDLTPRTCGCRCAEKVPDVDFVWVSRYDKDDEWLREDLDPLARDKGALRLHRYVTRARDSSDTSSGRGSSEFALDRRITLSCGRPKWDKLFAGIVETTASSKEVGVFFCGPERMGTEIRKALRNVEAFSNVRGAYISACTDEQIDQDFDIVDPDDISRLRKFGCNVRFVFREENF